MVRCPKLVGNASAIVIASLIFLSFVPEVGAEGMRVGASSVFIPSASVGLRYDDNILFVPEDDPVGPQSDLMLLAVPALRFKINKPNIKLNTGYELRTLTYMDVGNSEESHSKYNAIGHAGDLALLVQTNPGFFIELENATEYRKSTWEEEWYQRYYPTSQLHADSQVKLGVKRGPYRNLYTYIGYQNIWDYKPERDLSFFDRIQHRGLLEFNFRFLPRSGFVVKGMVGQVSYPNPADLSRFSPDQWGQLPSGYGAFFYQGVGGLDSYLTSVLRIKLLGGYAVWDYERSDDYQGFIGEGGLFLDFEQRGQASLGYRRVVDDRIMTNYRLSDVVYLDAWALIARRVKPRLYAAYHIRSYRGMNSYGENFLTVEPSVSVKLTRRFSSKLTYSYEGMVSSAGGADVARTRNAVTLELTFSF